MFIPNITDRHTVTHHCRVKGYAKLSSGPLWLLCLGYVLVCKTCKPLYRHAGIWCARFVCMCSKRGVDRRRADSCGCSISTGKRGLGQSSGVTQPRGAPFSGTAVIQWAWIHTETEPRRPFSTTLVTSAACTAVGGEQRKRHTSRVGDSQSGDELKEQYNRLEFWVILSPIPSIFWNI